MKSKLEYALEAARLGFHVFPLLPNKKTPPQNMFFKDLATQDEKQIQEWWTNGYADHNIGIYTGKYKTDKALLVLDVDNKEGKNGKRKMGESELLRLELEGMDFPETFEQLTPTGGRHIFYVVDKPVSQRALAKDIDTRSDGGYVVGFGSTIDGREYGRNATEEIPPAPIQLVSRLVKTKPLDTGNISVSSRDAVVRASDFLKHAEGAIQGDNGDQKTFTVAAELKDIGVDQQTALELMEELWNPKCQPPWQTWELETKIKNAYRYGQNPLGAKSPEAVFVNIPTNPEEKYVDKHTKKRGLYLEKFQTIEPLTNQEYLVDNFLSPNAMSVVYGESGSKKTFFALNLALHVSIGQPWNDKKVKQGAVFYVAAEGGPGMRKRVKAFRQYHKLENTNVPFGLIPCPIDLLNPQANAEELVILIKGFEASENVQSQLIVIDTLSRAMGAGNENSPDSMGAFIKNIDRIREATKAHLMIIHHSGKNKDSGARGHSSLRAATDTEILIEDQTAKTMKQRDMECGPPIGFRLEQVTIGQKQDGTPLNSCVVLPSNTTTASDFSKAPLDPSSLAGKGLKSLQNTLDFHGIDDEDTETVYVSIELWRQEFFSLVYPGQEKQNFWYKSFTRSVSQLVAGNFIEKDDESVWLK